MQTRECWYVFKQDRLLMFENQLLTQEQAKTLASQFLFSKQVGQFNGYMCYCAELDPLATPPDTFTFLPLRKAFEQLGSPWYQPTVKAYSILNWEKTHQFCGRCGHPTTEKEILIERLCTHCGLALYPRISPCVIVRIRKDDHILMARGPQFPPGAYGLIAGFVEVGENLEQTIHREVHEEVGLRVHNIRYFGSQPWPFPDSLMVGFTADYLSGELVLDQQEIEAADWYRYDNLPGRPSATISISNLLIDDFIAEYQGTKEQS